jgi:hypothetical protein
MVISRVVGDHFKTERRVAAFIVKWFAYDLANRVCIAGKPEVIRRRTLDRIGGFRPAIREVVQKSAWRRLPLISSKLVSRWPTIHPEGDLPAFAGLG